MWERILGHAAPEPVETGPRGATRLTARWCEWMMGFPPGYVTDVDGIPRKRQIRALGNAVVARQGAAAVQDLTRY